MKNSISIIVTTRNRKMETVDCISSILAQSSSKKWFEIILVDDDSSDGTILKVKHTFPQVKIISFKENKGFPAAINAGLRKASGDVIMILQSDTVLDKNFFKNIFPVIKKHPECGIFGPLVYYFDRPEIIEKAYGEFNSRTLDISGVGTNQNDEKYTKDFEVPVTVFCGLLIKRSTFDLVGTMDERFFVYFEDNDFFFRCRKQRIRFRFVPQAKLWHKSKKLTGRNSPLTTYYLTRNKLLLRATHTHLSLGEHLKNLRFLFSSFVFSLVNREQQKQFQAVVLAIFDFYRGRFGRSPYTL